MTRRALSFPALAAAGLAASIPCLSAGAQVIVSPARAVGAPGGRYTNQPFGEQRRVVHQQIHRDLRGQPFVVQLLAFRRGFGGTDAIARRVTYSIEIGYGDVRNVGATFASNFVGTPTTLATRRVVSLPAWTTYPSGGVLPAFDAIVGIDAPWFYDGTRDLAWQLTVHDNSTASSLGAVRPYVADAFREDTDVVDAGRELSPGCVPIGRFVPMQSTLMLRTSSAGPVPTVTILQGFSNGPRNSAGAIWLGLSDPQATVPGVCAPLRAGSLILELPGFTGPAGGFLAVGPWTVPLTPGLVGLPLFAQGFAVDQLRQPLPYTVSSGVTSTILAAPPPPALITTVQASGTDAAPAGTVRPLEGLVVRFN